MPSSLVGAGCTCTLPLNPIDAAPIARRRRRRPHWALCLSSGHRCDRFSIPACSHLVKSREWRGAGHPGRLDAAILVGGERCKHTHTQSSVPPLPFLPKAPRLKAQLLSPLGGRNVWVTPSLTSRLAKPVDARTETPAGRRLGRAASAPPAGRAPAAAGPRAPTAGLRHMEPACIFEPRC